MAQPPGLRVLSSLALKGVLEKFRPELERAVGPLELRFDATQAILPLVRRGEPADLLILTAEAMDELRAAGAVTRSWLLGSSGVGVAVRAGEARPDISSVEALKAALLSARSVAHSKVGASGIYFSELLERLGIAARLKKRVVIEKGPVGLAVAAGEAELGVQHALRARARGRHRYRRAAAASGAEADLVFGWHSRRRGCAGRCRARRSPALGRSARRHGRRRAAAAARLVLKDSP